MSVPNLIDAICTSWTKCLPAPWGSGEFYPAADQTHGSTTHCNQFVNDVCNQFGYTKFNGLTANQMFDALSLNGDWMEVPGDVAQFHTNNGALVIAAWKNPTESHGHVCMVRPGSAGPSKSWGVVSDAVPKVANVSEPALCRIDRKASFAFGMERMPKYFAKKDMIP